MSYLKKNSRSTFDLIAVNLGVILFIVKDEWGIATILTAYALQSFIIGIFQAKKMLDLKEFTTDGLKINRSYVKANRSTKIKMALFFIFHYGIFHASYVGVIYSEAGKIEWLFVYVSGVAFFINHLFSYLFQRKNLIKIKPNIGRVMLFSYLRIIPMHICAIFGSFLAGPDVSIVFFLLLKTIADVAMHVLEYRGRKIVHK